MGLFDEVLKDSESLFKEELALDFEYQPKLLKFRENEQFQIASSIKPLFQKRNGGNVFITGKPGIGKTVATKHVLNEIEQETNDILPIYVNCWQKDTSFKIILSICDSIGYKFTQNKNTDELWGDVSKILNKRSSVIVLDEADKIQDYHIIYSLLEDLYRKSILLITNDKEFLSSLDQRILSRLIPEVIEFKPYNEEETYEILKQRAEAALAKNVLTNDALKLISEKSFELKDIRVGLFLVREAGNIAEQRLKKKIEKEEAEKAVEKLKDFKIKNSSSLSDEQNKILEIIKENNGKTTTEVHKFLENDISYRTFFRKLKELEKLNLISMKEENIGPGKKTIINFGSTKKLDTF